MGGGSNNRAGNDVAPTIDAQFGTVGGGADNTASANFATVAGGRGNSAAAVKATVAGGGRSNDVDVTTGNEATDDFSTVGGGGNNQAGNGDLDTTNATFATVAGGFSNTASGVRATVGGGEVNMASSLAATIGGGAGNEASATAATVGGGTTNVASGSRATVPGGLANRAQGQFSFAAGNRAKALHDGAFVWGDSTAADVNSTATDQFTLRASGGLRMVVGATPTQVFSVAANGTVTASTVLASNASFSDDLAPGLTVVNVDNLGGGEGLKASSGGRGVLAQGGSVGVQGDGLGSGTGVQGGTDSGIAVNGISNTGIAGVFQSINPGGTILTGRNGGGLGTEVFRVSGTGNVGIGTASPDQKLTIAGGIHNTISMRGTGIPGLRLFSEDGSARDWRVETGRSAVANLDISDCSAACAPRLTINSSGRVGIGTGSPANAKLMVEASFTLARFNLTGSDGSLVDFDRDAVGIGNISVAAGIVSYNAFTGSHYGWTNQPIERGMLVTLTGQNKTLHDRPGFEPVYGITKSARANDPRILGAYLARSEPGKAEEPVTENPHLVMAVGNGDMWVVDTGEDIQPGDALISSDTPGHGMKDSDRFEVSYVVARAAEPVRWSEVTEMVNGVKHKRISILFDSQVREKTAVLAAEVAALRKQLAAQTAELEQAKQVLAQLAKQLSLRRAQQ